MTRSIERILLRPTARSAEDVPLSYRDLNGIS